MDSQLAATEVGARYGPRVNQQEEKVDTPHSVRARLARVATTYVVVAAAVVGLGWLLTHPLAGSVGAFDDDVSRWFADRRTPGLDRVADVVTFVADTWVGVLVALAVAVAAGVCDRSWRGPVLVVAAVVGHLGIYLLGTHLAPRDRPPVEILDPGLVPDHSFPSGHVGTAVIAYGCVAVVLALRLRSAPVRRTVVGLLALVPFLVALSRLYQGAHHVTDVTTSLVYASVWLLVLARAGGWLTSRPSSSG
ncbi:undecaprenyl-diphosphatase [Nocardioides psychrotolerans]|uniref:Undecaprenyl-diphosphatase n=1 Tax=Nocardioides psychrotolerans TaxID=1005945 RepID=A0A1I3H8N0_9ACTN|nr:undecaprenyl-diphosphatase [Nocardioides psychrotolerans]